MQFLNLDLKRNVKFYYFLFMLLVQKQALYVCGGRRGLCANMALYFEDVWVCFICDEAMSKGNLPLR